MISLSRNSSNPWSLDLLISKLYLRPLHLDSRGSEGVGEALLYEEKYRTCEGCGVKVKGAHNCQRGRLLNG